MDPIWVPPICWIFHPKFRLRTEKNCSFTVSRISGSLWDIKLWEIFSCICFWNILPKILGVIDWEFRSLRDWLICFLFVGMIMNWLIQWRWRKRRTEAEFIAGGTAGCTLSHEALNRIELPHKVSFEYKRHIDWLVDWLIDLLVDWCFAFNVKGLYFSIFRARFVQDAWNKHVDTWVTLMLPRKPWGVSSFKFGSAGVQKTNSIRETFLLFLHSLSAEK